MKKVHCSKLRQAQLCPGSLLAQDGLPEQSNPEAAAGTRFHEAMAKGDPAGLDERLTTLYHEFKAKELQIGDTGGATVTRIETKHENEYLVGTPDKVVMDTRDGVFHIYDWKSGFAEQPSAEQNMQLRGYAYLMFREQAATEVFVNLFSAEGTKPVYSTARYSLHNLALAGIQCREIVRKANAPDAPRIPSDEACQWCRARGNPTRCPESCKEIKALAKTSKHPATLRKPTKAMAKRIEKLYLAGKEGEKSWAKFKAYLREVLKEHPDSIPGLTLKPGRMDRKLTDPEAVYNIGLHEWFEREGFLECVTISLPKLKMVARKHTGKKLDIQIEERLAAEGCLDVKQGEPSIREEK